MLKLVTCIIVCLLLTACSPGHITKGAKPPGSPYFVGGAGAGATLGAGLAGALTPSSVAGPGVWTGGLLGAAVGSYFDSQGLFLSLQKHGVTIFELGDTLEIVIPADYLFEGADTEIKISAYPILNEIAHLLQEYQRPERITITGHTDNTGYGFSRIELSTMQAQAVTTFLWSNGIPLELMDFYGLADKEEVGNFRSSVGAAYNRRIEITLWRSSPPSPMNIFLMSLNPDQEEMGASP